MEAIRGAPLWTLGDRTSVSRIRVLSTSAFSIPYYVARSALRASCLKGPDLRIACEQRQAHDSSRGVDQSVSRIGVKPLGGDLGSHTCDRAGQRFDTKHAGACGNLQPLIKRRCELQSSIRNQRCDLPLCNRGHVCDRALGEHAASPPSDPIFIARYRPEPYVRIHHARVGVRATHSTQSAGATSVPHRCRGT